MISYSGAKMLKMTLNKTLATLIHTLHPPLLQIDGNMSNPLANFSLSEEQVAAFQHQIRDYKALNRRFTGNPALESQFALFKAARASRGIHSYTSIYVLLYNVVQ